MTELVREHDAGVKNGVAVVFVHGWEDDRQGSWTYPAAGKRPSWPQWLGQDAHCDTWTLDYDASLSAWRDVAGAVHINGLSLMDKLATDTGLAERPLILLAHGVGGLLVKKAIVHALTKAAPRHRRMVGRIAAIGLIATPQSGVQLNTIAQALAMARHIAPSGKDFFADDAQVQELQREFAQLAEQLSGKVHVYTESKPVVTGRKWLGLWKTRAVAVPYDAQNPHIAGATITTLADDDHFTICQPRDKTVALHRSIAALIDACKAWPIVVEESVASQVDSVPPVVDAPIADVPVAETPTAAPIAVPASKIEAPTVQEELAPVLKEVPPPPPLPVVKQITSRPALIVDAQDARLQLNESKLYGRDRELTRLLSFLDQTNERAAIVLPRAGNPGVGIGKTELCKAALKLWMQRDTQRKVFFIALTDNADQAEFLQALASGIGLDAFDDEATTLAAMPAGLYYIDNLGSFAQGDSGRQWIERVKNLPDVRLLISSPHALPADFAQAIEIDALPKQSALNLFRDLWGGGDVLPVDTALTQFVDNDLQRHAMSTALLARLGIFFGYDDMRVRWRALRAANPAEPGVQTSLRLVKQALSTKTGALAMWQAIAQEAQRVQEGQQSQGVDATQLLLAEADGTYPRGTAEFLQHHGIVHRIGNRFVMSSAVIAASVAD